MPSAFIPPGLGYPAVALACQQVHQRPVHPGPLVLGAAPLRLPAPAPDRDRTVSRRSEPSSRTALMGEQPSVIQYLISYRLERACHLLLHTTESVTDIALNCGFENISYFIRKFREFTKETPKEYRSNHQIPKISAQTPSTR